MCAPLAALAAGTWNSAMGRVRKKSLRRHRGVGVRRRRRRTRGPPAGRRRCRRAPRWWRRAASTGWRRQRQAVTVSVCAPLAAAVGVPHVSRGSVPEQLAAPSAQSASNTRPAGRPEAVEVSAPLPPLAAGGVSLNHEVFDKTTRNCPPSGFGSDPWERGRPRARRPARFAMSQPPVADLRSAPAGGTPAFPGSHRAVWLRLRRVRRWPRCRRSRPGPGIRRWGGCGRRVSAGTEALPKLGASPVDARGTVRPMVTAVLPDGRRPAPAPRAGPGPPGARRVLQEPQHPHRARGRGVEVPGEGERQGGAGLHRGLHRRRDGGGEG